MVVEGNLLDRIMVAAAAEVVEDDLVLLIGLSFEVKLTYTLFKVHFTVSDFQSLYFTMICTVVFFPCNIDSLFTVI